MNVAYILWRSAASAPYLEQKCLVGEGRIPVRQVDFHLRGAFRISVSISMSGLRRTGTCRRTADRTR
jgi:hypothetical protein